MKSFVFPVAPVIVYAKIQVAALKARNLLAVKRPANNGEKEHTTTIKLCTTPKG
jgi:hypothetical protein